MARDASTNPPRPNHWLHYRRAEATSRRSSGPRAARSSSGVAEDIPSGVNAGHRARVRPASRERTSVAKLSQERSGVESGSYAQLMHLDEYMAHDATALAKLVARKEVTPAELLALARQRAEAVNPTLNAIVRRLDDVADRQAADADLSGAFAGVPFLIK